MSLIHYGTRIHFADRALEDALPEELRRRSIVAPLIVTDADTGEALARLIDCLPPGCRPQVLDGTRRAGTTGPGPFERMRAVLDAADHDALIGLGGALALHLALIGGQRDGTAALPVIALPTLPGCVGLGPPGSGLPKARRALRPVWPVPDILICDPGLIQTGAPDRLAEAGMDAMVHCLEALLSTAWNPPADGIAFDGLRRAGAWLERMVADPTDPEARCEMLAAALNGALAAQKGFGAIHALSHALESTAGETARHGRLHALLAGPALAFNAPAVPDRIGMAAEALRLGGRDELPPHFAALGARLGLPARLDDLGLTEAGLQRVAAAAAEDPANLTNPRHAVAADYRRMIEAAL